METTQKTIVKFHISRGGRFNNQGYIRFVGCESIGEGKAFEDLFYNEDEKCYRSSTGELHDLLTDEDVESGIGVINIDYGYDTTYTKYIEDCNSTELSKIAEANPYNLKELISESGVFENDNVIDVLMAFDFKLEEALYGEFFKNTLEFIGIEEITEEEYEEEYNGEEVNGKYYRLES